jgi:hypothetical protein
VKEGSNHVFGTFLRWDIQIVANLFHAERVHLRPQMPINGRAIKKYPMGTYKTNITCRDPFPLADPLSDAKRHILLKGRKKLLLEEILRSKGLLEPKRKKKEND